MRVVGGGGGAFQHFPPIILYLYLLYFIGREFSGRRFVTQIAKICLIAGERNCSYRPFLSSKSSFVNFLFSSKIKNMTFLYTFVFALSPGGRLR